MGNNVIVQTLKDWIESWRSENIVEANTNV